MVFCAMGLHNCLWVGCIGCVHGKGVGSLPALHTPRAMNLRAVPVLVHLCNQSVATQRALSNTQLGTCASDDGSAFTHGFTRHACDYKDTSAAENTEAHINRQSPLKAEA